MKRKIFLFVVLLCAVVTLSVRASETFPDVTAVYFYSSSCSSCQKLTKYFNEYEQKYSGLHFIKYNITEIENKSILNQYSELYQVYDEDEGIIPIVFIRASYFVGEEEIIENLESQILNNIGIETMLISDTAQNFLSDKITP